MDGSLLPLKDVQDQAFASKAMGDGFAIDRKGSQVVSPVNGEVIVRFPTNHTYGLKTSDGKEILIHIGMDTVELNGEGFIPHVQVGDMVHKGNLLCEVDPALIASKNKSLVSPIVFTSGETIQLKKHGAVHVREEEIIQFD